MTSNMLAGKEYLQKLAAGWIVFLKTFIHLEPQNVT